MSNKLDTDTQIGRLIALVKPHPILYDESVEGFHDKEKKELLWTDIAKKLGASSRNCRRKWVGLMLKYRKREDEGEIAVTDENGKVWPWYPKMQFLRRRHEDITSVVEPIPPSEMNHVATNLETEVLTEIKVNKFSPSNNAKAFPTNASLNLNGNKLFLESLAEDLSSLCLADQYEFKRKMMDLMLFYISK